MLNDCSCYDHDDLGISLEILLDRSGHGRPHISRAHALVERGGLVAERPILDREIKCSNHST